MRHAIIDIGSNSIRLVVYEVNMEDKTFTIVYDKKHMAGLAGFVDDDRRLTDRGVSRAIECIQSHLAQCASMGLEKKDISAFATASIRNTSNSWEVVRAINQACDFEISLLSGATEAHAGFRGAMYDTDAEDGVLVDIGGGSTEVTRFENRKVVHTISLPYGSLNMFMNQVEGLLPTAKEIHRIKGIIKEELANVPEFYGFKCTTVYCIGGAARAAVMLSQDMFYDSARVTETTSSQIHKMLDRASVGSKDELLHVLSICPERVHTVFPGMAIEAAVIEQFGAEKAHVVRHGLREGYLLSFVMGAAE